MESTGTIQGSLIVESSGADRRDIKEQQHYQQKQENQKKEKKQEKKKGEHDVGNFFPEYIERGNVEEEKRRGEREVSKRSGASSTSWYESTFAGNASFPLIFTGLFSLFCLFPFFSRYYFFICIFFSLLLLFTGIIIANPVEDDKILHLSAPPSINVQVSGRFCFVSALLLMGSSIKKSVYLLQISLPQLFLIFYFFLFFFFFSVNVELLSAAPLDPLYTLSTSLFLAMGVDFGQSGSVFFICYFIY